MRTRRPPWRVRLSGLLICGLLWSPPAFAATAPTFADDPLDTVKSRRTEDTEQTQEEAEGVEAQKQDPTELETPPLPEGMTLEEVLEYAAGLSPSHFPEPVPMTRCTRSCS